MGRYDSYQAEVGRAQGSSVLFITSAGFFDVGDVDNGANGDRISGAVLRLQLLSPITRTSVMLSTNSVLAVNSTLLIKYGYVALRATGNPSTCSLRMPSAEVGATLFLDMRAWQSDISILPGNASLAFGDTLSDLSCIMIVNGSVNSAWLELKCFTAGEWAIANQSNRTGVSGQVSS